MRVTDIDNSDNVLLWIISAAIYLDIGHRLET
jgi:hypothetical protein